MNSQVSQKDVYKKSRGFMIASCLFTYLITLCTGGAYFAKLTTAVGISDTLTALLSAITQLGGIFQIISILLAHKTPVKRWIIPLQLTTHLLYAFLFMIPLINIKGYQAVAVVLVTVLTRAIANVCAPPKNNWIFSLVDDRRRGSFQGLNSTVSLCGGVIFSFLVGRAVDLFEAQGNISRAFVFLTALIFVLSVFDLVFLFLVKEKKLEIAKMTSPFQDVRSLLSNKRFRRLIVTYVLWEASTWITLPFLGTYQIKELGFSMTTVATLTSVSTLLQIAVVYFFGKFSNKHSFASIFAASLPIAIAAHVLLAFANPTNGIIFYPLYMLGQLIYSNMHIICYQNLIFDIVPYTQRTGAVAIKTVAVGGLAFLTTLAVTPLFNHIQANGNQLFGISIYAQQVLASISALSLALTAVYYFLFCKPLLKETKIEM